MASTGKVITCCSPSLVVTVRARPKGWSLAAMSALRRPDCPSALFVGHALDEVAEAQDVDRHEERRGEGVPVTACDSLTPGLDHVDVGAVDDRIGLTLSPGVDDLDLGVGSCRPAVSPFSL